MRSILAVSLLALIPTSAHAHAIGLNCTLRGDKVAVEVYYDDDSPGAKAKIEVVNAKDEIIASGITDAKGKWSFATPMPGKYEVRVDGGAGHRAKKTITVSGPPADERGEPDVSLVREGSNSEDSARAEFTSVPWLKVVIGLVVIGACASAFLLVTLLRATCNTTKPAGDEGACVG